MGERKGVNKYYPPDYDPNKGGLNKFLGTHALRERARKLHMGILIIRFEMPYNIWCEGCEKHIGMGVRYNAEKKKVGMYYSTPVYQFRMKCHLCDNHFEIKTDPANLDYVIVSGARRQEGRWDPLENGQVVPEDKNVSRKMAVDAMYRLEHGVEDINKSKEIKTTIERLEDMQSSRWKDDYAANGALREIMRAKRKETKIIQARDKLFNLNVPLLPPSEDDDKMAALLQFSQMGTSEEKASSSQVPIDSQSVFSTTANNQPCSKKDFARKAIVGILSENRRNFTSYSNDFAKGNLGIKKKGIEVTDEVNNEDKKYLQDDNKLITEKFVGKSGLIVSYDSSNSDSD